MKLKFTKSAVLVLVAALVLGTAGCTTNTTAGSSGLVASAPEPTQQGSSVSAEPTSLVTSQAAVTDEDGNDQWDAATATKIQLADGGTTVEGEGARAVGSVVTISAGGTYLITGSLSDGQLIVSAPKTTVVHLVLNGVDIKSSTSAPIYGVQANKIIVTLAEGSKNTLTDGASYIYADVASEEPDAALFSKVDLSLNGTGTLVVNGSFNNGIGSKDDLVISSGNYQITAPNHGIRGRDSLTILGGDFAITAGNDGLQSNNDEDLSKGWINLQGGTYQIETGHDGIQAETTLSISGGEYSIVAGSAATTASSDTSDSYKGIKGGGNLAITGGDLTIQSADDSVHSNGNIELSGGTLLLDSGDDGIHADGSLTVLDGTITVTNSYEGIEASTMTLAGGEIHIVSTDDGINVAGGTDTGETAEAPAPRFGGDNFASNSNRWLYITGGKIWVNAEGDGIDVNGNTAMSGGEVYVSGPTRSGNGALDYDGTFEITGGVLVAAGSSGMAMAPTSSSAQPSVMLYYSSAQPAGTVVGVQGADGQQVAEFAPEKTFQTVVLSAPALTVGETYTITSNGAELTQVTLEEGVTSISDTGEAVAQRGGMGGMMGGERGGGMGAGPMGAPGERPTQPPPGAPTT